MSLPAYFEQGDGDTAIFLLHGVGGGKAAWVHNQPVLAAADYKAVAWDMPGYGDSRAILPCTNALLADALKTLMAHIGAKRNVLMGHSMGGMIAQELAALHPSLVHGLVLYSTSPAFGKPDGAWQQQFLQSRFSPLDQGLGMDGLAEKIVPAMFALGADPSRLAEAISLMSRVPADSYRAALSAIVSFNRLAALGHIAVPTLCLAGELDLNAPPAVVEKMANRIPGAQYACLPGVGHI
ncbi:MAG: alpha/beta hydrolase, partial [Pseudomonadota bacterium]|nr:alpha/beta hydrolase [Pseudomonadota bacterium]